MARPRSATTSSARTRRCAPSRSGSPTCSGTRPRSSRRRARWPTSSACGCTSGRGEELVGDSLAHVVRAELGAAAVLSGISSRTWVSERGRFRADDAASLMITGVGPYQVCTVARDRREHPQLRRRHGAVRSTRSAARARSPGSAASRMHLDGARLFNAHVASGRAGRRLRPRVRHRLGLPEQGPRRAGRQRARRVGRGHGRVADLAQALRRRHASGRDPRGRRPFRARPQRRAARRRPRPGAARGRGDGRGGSRLRRPRRRSRPTSSSSTWPRWAGPPRPSSTPPSPHGVRTYAVGPGAVRLVWHLDVDDAGTDVAIDVVTGLLRSGPS